MKNALPDKKNAAALSCLLRRINEGADPKQLRHEASKLMSHIRPQDITEAEQHLIRNGYSPRLAGQLAEAFLLLGAMQGQLPDWKRELTDNHILRQVTVEHDMIRYYLADLTFLNEEIFKKQSLRETESDFMKLSHVIEHLYAMFEHLEREDDVLFPFLQKQGWTSLCRAARMDHELIRDMVESLIRLIGTYKAERFDSFRTRLNGLIRQFVPMMKEHLFHEETVLFPISVGIIKDQQAWRRIKDVCDEIGYCGLHV